MEKRNFYYFKSHPSRSILLYLSIKLKPLYIIIDPVLSIQIYSLIILTPINLFLNLL